VKKYQSLGTDRKHFWDKVKFSRESLQDIRMKLSIHIDTLTLLLTILDTSALGRIERKLDKLTAEIMERRGSTRAPTILTVSQFDEKETTVNWSGVKTELIDEGLSEAEIEEHKPWIIRKFMRLLGLDETPEQPQDANEPESLAKLSESIANMRTGVRDYKDNTRVSDVNVEGSGRNQRAHQTYADTPENKPQAGKGTWGTPKEPHSSEQWKSASFSQQYPETYLKPNPAAQSQYRPGYKGEWDSARHNNANRRDIRAQALPKYARSHSAPDIDRIPGHDTQMHHQKPLQTSQNHWTGDPNTDKSIQYLYEDRERRPYAINNSIATERRRPNVIPRPQDAKNAAVHSVKEPPSPTIVIREEVVEEYYYPDHGNYSNQSRRHIPREYDEEDYPSYRPRPYLTPYQPLEGHWRHVRRPRSCDPEDLEHCTNLCDEDVHWHDGLPTLRSRGHILTEDNLRRFNQSQSR
jgi:hypothetical protein